MSEVFRWDRFFSPFSTPKMAMVGARDVCRVALVEVTVCVLTGWFLSVKNVFCLDVVAVASRVWMLRECGGYGFGTLNVTSD